MPGPRLPIGWIVSALVLSAGGGGGWLLWRHQQHTLQQLRATQLTLTTRDATLKTLEDEHQRLSESYDTLKDRWTAADAQAQQLSRASAEQTKQLATLTTDRAKTQQQLEETKKDKQQLLRQLNALEQHAADAGAKHSALKSQLDDLAVHSLTPAEAEQLAQSHVRSVEERHRLADRLATLSRTVEQLVQSQEQLEAQVMKRKGPSQGRAPTYPSAQRLAGLYQDLGKSYLATYQYAKAADALERSLTFQDDLDTHNRLAFLYSRLLHNRQKAEQHLAKASSTDHSTSTLGGAASAYGLPRNEWQLLWQWLTQ